MSDRDINDLKSTLNEAREQIGRVLIGQREVVDLALITIMTGSHALIEGVPGVAKTLLVKTIACVLGVPFNRIQFTPDLMPSDITGTNIFNLARNEFTLVRGPIFTSFLLADEINRAPAKTQSALLQAMQERSVTIDRDTHLLPDNFTVFATQNPIEYEGTYPLPEAQKDRFTLKIRMALPAREEEMELARRMLSDDAPESVLDRKMIVPVAEAAHLPELRKSLNQVTVKPELIDYAVNIVRGTREHEAVMVGAGPRATQALVLTSRAHALIENRDYVTPDDIKRMSIPVLEHRIILRPEYEIEGVDVAEVVARILQKVAVPR